jgi:hypothetical protein
MPAAGRCSPSARTRATPRAGSLENVPPGRSFDLLRAPGGERVRTVTSAELSAGIDVSISEGGGAEVLGIVPSP